MSGVGPVEALVLEAWGVGVRIDTDVSAQQAKLVELLTRAREIDANEGRCGHKEWRVGETAASGRCELPRGHTGSHMLPEGKAGT